MSPYVLAAYLLLVGIMSIFHAEIPGWVAGLLALAAGLAILIEAKWRKV